MERTLGRADFPETHIVETCSTSKKEISKKRAKRQDFKLKKKGGWEGRKGS